MQVKLEVDVNPEFDGLVEGAVSFETGLTREQAADPTLYAYEHHGAEFSATDPGALSSFHEDVILGRPMPTKFACRTLNGPDTLVAIALFLHRDLATHPSFPGVVASVDLAHRRGPQGLAHIDPELASLLLHILDNSTPKNESARLSDGVRWIYEFVNQYGTPPGRSIPQPQIKDAGSRGFVVAELTRGALVPGWVRLYQMGYLRGFLVGPERDGRRPVVASRKSVFVDFNLVRAASIFNEVEAAMGQAPEWRADELWLYSPSKGTALSVEDLKEVFLRV